MPVAGGLLAEDSQRQERERGQELGAASGGELGGEHHSSTLSASSTGRLAHSAWWAKLTSVRRRTVLKPSSVRRFYKQFPPPWLYVPILDREGSGLAVHRW